MSGASSGLKGSRLHFAADRTTDKGVMAPFWTPEFGSVPQHAAALKRGPLEADLIEVL